MAQGSLLHAVQNTALLFPGQGSQQVGMAQAAAAAYPAARAALDEADEVLGFPLSRLMADGPEETLTDTVNAQPALLVASIALLRAIETELGARQLEQQSALHNVYVAGHSMGEYTALVAAGSLHYADGLRLVRERGRLMKQAGTRSPGMMAAVLGLDEDKVAALCAEVAQGGGIVRSPTTTAPARWSSPATSTAWKRPWPPCAPPAPKRLRRWPSALPRTAP